MRREVEEHPQRRGGEPTGPVLPLAQCHQVFEKAKVNTGHMFSEKAGEERAELRRVK